MEALPYSPSSLVPTPVTRQQCPGINLRACVKSVPWDSQLTELLLPNTGPSGSGHTELPAVTPELWTSSEEVFQATDLTEPSVPNHVSWEAQTLSIQTSDRTFIRGGSVSEAETRVDKTMALMTRKPSEFTAVISPPTAASSTGGSPTGRVRTTVDTVTGSELWKAVFENLCTFDSSEEAKRILKFIHISAEAEALSSESSASSDSSVPAVTTSQVLSSDITALTKALVTYITNIKVINCRVMETEPTAAIPGTSHIDHSSVGEHALSPPERSASPDSTEAKSHLTRNTTSVETWTIAHATESVTPAGTAIPSSTPEKETTAAKATSPSGTLVTVSKGLLEERSGLSVETTSDTSISGIMTVFTEDVATVCEFPSAVANPQASLRLWTKLLLLIGSSITHILSFCSFFISQWEKKFGV
ncbi:hypothetical protein MG293_000642 [Ovis ammon polii]|uniref:Uncharacterized protein n=1 Tax=Ovis ammon polii TaxID=230172 RepID=A0AAD4UKN8_OVIAM|nr:hypothetical protein MG293_000642 [Ovis ammon polii]